MNMIESGFIFNKTKQFLERLDMEKSNCRELSGLDMLELLKEFESVLIFQESEHLQVNKKNPYLTLLELVGEMALLDKTLGFKNNSTLLDKMDNVLDYASNKGGEINAVITHLMMRCQNYLYQQYTNSDYKINSSHLIEKLDVIIQDYSTQKMLFA